MIIEKIPIRLPYLNLDEIQLSKSMKSATGSSHMNLNDSQIQILKLMSQGACIEQIVNHFYQQGKMISFLGLRRLIEFLVEERLLVTIQFARYFKKKDVKERGFFSQLLGQFSKPDLSEINVVGELSHFPFFRALEPELQKVFFENMKVVSAPSQIAICNQGHIQRALFALLRGEAQVYKKSPDGKRTRIASLPQGSVFGESGFFLGEPRSADVLTSESSVIAKFKYLPEFFDRQIQKEKAESLKKRFWMVHSLMKSEVFNSLPEDCFDSLLFSGELKTFSPDRNICTEGEFGTTCYLIIQGTLVVTQNGKSIRTLGQGDCFGEMALLLNQGKRTATVKSQTECLVMEIKSESFYKLLSQNLMLGCEFENLALERWNYDLTKY
ncbi:MAG: cyclic nucleotide-binding domain-containing protein [Proteobacteria bacterium]|jgi:CRP-like cAMP-binding protein|nr:cyclic nucleotide-binding domain-containing protein [Pseudomonadota bacterium]